jgi:cytochrome c
MIKFALAFGMIALIPMPLLAGSPEAGRQDFRQECSICHSPVKGRNETGPSLFGVVGRLPSSAEGFHYSQGNKDAHIKWNDEELDKYLLSPRCVVPGTTMTFTGLKDPTKREDVIAYLDTLK